MTKILKTQTDWVPLSVGAVRPTQGRDSGSDPRARAARNPSTPSTRCVCGPADAHAIQTPRSLMATIYLEFDAAARMRPSFCYERVMKTVVVLVKFPC